MKLLKGIVASLILGLLLLMPGCAIDGTNIGDGKVDPVESAVIQLSVGATMAAYPKTIVPAFQVTSVLLALKEDSTTNLVALVDLDSVLAAEVAKLDLDPLTMQSFNDLIILVKASLAQQLSDTGIADSDKLVVAWKFIEIVNNTAKVRLNKSLEM